MKWAHWLLCSILESEFQYAETFHLEDDSIILESYQNHGVKMIKFHQSIKLTEAKWR